jgi:GNAT superfamily N-acetyltransferase
MEQTDLTIRPANETDRKQLEGLIAECYATVYPGWYDNELLGDALPAMLKIDPKLIASGCYFVAEVDNKVAGCGGWSAGAPGKELSEESVGHIRHFATDPQLMRKGVGGAILEQCIKEASSFGLAKLKCFSSLPAEGFYARHGFEKIDQVNVMLGEAVYFPAVLMEKRLA